MSVIWQCMSLHERSLGHSGFWDLQRLGEFSGARGHKCVKSTVTLYQLVCYSINVLSILLGKYVCQLHIL